MSTHSQTEGSHTVEQSSSWSSCRCWLMVSALMLQRCCAAPPQVTGPLILWQGEPYPQRRQTRGTKPRGSLTFRFSCRAITLLGCPPPTTCVRRDSRWPHCGSSAGRGQHRLRYRPPDGAGVGSIGSACIG